MLYGRRGDRPCSAPSTSAFPQHPGIRSTSCARDGTDSRRRAPGRASTSTKRDRVLTKERATSRPSPATRAQLAAGQGRSRRSHKAEVGRPRRGRRGLPQGALRTATTSNPCEASCAAEKLVLRSPSTTRPTSSRPRGRAPRETLSSLSDSNAEVKDENYVYKNRRFDAKVVVPDRDAADQGPTSTRPSAIAYHLIDMLRMGKFTFGAEVRPRSARTTSTRSTRRQLPAQERPVYRHPARVHRPVCRGAHREGHAAAHLSERAEHPAAGLAAHVPTRLASPASSCSRAPTCPSDAWLAWA